MDFWMYVDLIGGEELVTTTRKLLASGYVLSDLNIYKMWADSQNAPKREVSLISEEEAAKKGLSAGELAVRADFDARAKEAEAKVKATADALTGGGGGGGGGANADTLPPKPTYEIPGYHWEYDGSNLMWVPVYDGTPKKDTTTMAGETPNYTLVGQTRQKPDGSGVIQTYAIRLIDGNYVGIWDDTGFDETQSLDYKYKQAVEESSKKDREERQRQFDTQMAWYQQQASMEQLTQQQARAEDMAARKAERLAQLAATPSAWLQHAALSGQTPSVQAWMLPLMNQQYGITQAGQQLPGWSPPTTENAQPMTSLPDLARPSQQYLARMGPTAAAQYGGYQQARTGATPDETAMRLWSLAPPSGRNRGLSYVR